MTLIKNILRAVIIFSEEKNIVPGRERIRILPCIIHWVEIVIKVVYICRSNTDIPKDLRCTVIVRLVNKNCVNRCQHK